MIPFYRDSAIMLFHGDNLAALRTLSDNSVDSIVTDPPYGLKFMGKKWDYEVPSVETWAECLRVLKPGGYLLSFAGTRTQHRMACNIEDAGFEIRDVIFWHYGSGFPKSLNVSKSISDAEKSCNCHKTMLSFPNGNESKKMPDMLKNMDPENQVSGQEQHVRSDVRGPVIEGEVYPEKESAGNALRDMRENGSPPAAGFETECGDLLRRVLPKQDLCGAPGSICGEHEGAAREGALQGIQPSMEGWGNHEATEGELQGGAICARANLGQANGAEGWVHNGAPPSNGGDVRIPSDAGGGGGSLGSQPGQQLPGKSGAIPNQRGSQTWGGWSICGRCQKPIIPEGIGTALKPATEPITMARKPLIGTVAENVLTHGTGGINVDECRIPAPDGLTSGGSCSGESALPMNKVAGVAEGRERSAPNVGGRWPANLIHDGSPEVLDLFPTTKSGTPGIHRLGENTGAAYGAESRAPGTPMAGHGDAGSAARFFYCAKASKADRDDGMQSVATTSASEMTGGRKEGSAGLNDPRAGAGRTGGGKNNHPTVKPLDLMRYLCRLVTPRGGVTLDPWMGSGSTGRAAVLEGFGFVGMERDLESVLTSQIRILHTRQNGAHK